MTPRVTLITLIGMDEDEYRRRALAELAAGIAQPVRIIEAPRSPDDDADET